jgi:hypothetical protein
MQKGNVPNAAPLSSDILLTLQGAQITRRELDRHHFVFILLPFRFGICDWNSKLMEQNDVEKPLRGRREILNIAFFEFVSDFEFRISDLPN